MTSSGIEISKKVLEYETFVNERLKVDLSKVIEERDKLYSKISEYEQLITVIEKLTNADVLNESLKTKIDIGCNFYVQAVVPDLKTILVEIGYGLYLELTLPEAVNFAKKKITFLNNLSQTYSNKALKIKAHIKLVLEGLRELQGFDMEDDSHVCI